MSDVREADIQKAVVDRWRTIGLPGTFIGAIPNQRAFGQPGLTAGLPDLILIGPPRLHGYLELKTTTGKLSGPQREFQSLCIARGIPFYVTYGLDQAIALIEDLGIVRRAA
jgi:hypothetical protein